MFHRLAKYYDDLYGGRDTRAEIRTLEERVRRFGRSRGRAWLDVACGTGRHLDLLRARYAVTGVDASREMLAVARRRMPGVRLVSGDMRNFDLGTTFDVVTCLFSAIGHLRAERELAATFRNFARHLKPGGVVIVEPWIHPEVFRPGHIALVTFQNASRAIARMSTSSRRGNRSIVRYQYLIGETGRGVEYLEESDVGLLVSPARLVELMDAAGLTSRFLRTSLTPGRGLLVGVRPIAGSPGRRTTR